MSGDRCKKCGSGAVRRVIENWGSEGEMYVFLACECGSQIWDARPFYSSEEGNWPDLLDGEPLAAVVVPEAA
jgi:hypothetical protein